MSVDLIRLVLLLAALVRYGPPDSWDVAAQVRLSIAIPDPSGSVSLALDPVPIYYRELPGDLCGEYNGLGVFVNPRAGGKGCTDTLQHELAHVWQARAYGLLQPISYAVASSIWEPERPWEGAPPAPRTLEWALLKIWWPLY